MKVKLIIFLALLLSAPPGHAQFLKKLKKRVKHAAEETVIRKSEQKTSETIDDALEEPFKKDKNQDAEPSVDEPTTEVSTTNDDTEPSTSNDTQATASNDPEPQLWSKYNFVPGDKIIFYDDLSDEESGEFPARWDLLNGTAENASLDGENVINIGHKAIITPLMDEEKYLPEVFTLEFDAYFKRKHGPGYQSYYIRLWPGSNNRFFHGADKKDFCESIKVNQHGASMYCYQKSNGKRLESFDNSRDEKEGVWRHVAIAFNKRSLKVFLDEQRVINSPNLGFRPEAFSIGTFRVYEEPCLIKNIRIAEGGKKLYDRVMEEGKFVTRGILFDVNSANIKPESGGVLAEVAKMMKEHTDLSFRIEGHTDSDGADDYNQKLSSQRAESVKEALVELGVESSRFETVGMGESVPVDNNATAEGKANNRRVEFVKL